MSRAISGRDISSDNPDKRRSVSEISRSIVSESRGFLTTLTRFAFFAAKGRCFDPSADADGTNSVTRLARATDAERFEDGALPDGRASDTATAGGSNSPFKRAAFQS